MICKFKNTNSAALLLSVAMILSALAQVSKGQDEVLDEAALKAVEEVAAEVDAAVEAPLAAMTPEEQEAAAQAKQLAEQEIARWAVPLISGFVIDGMDPDSPQDNGIVVLSNGTGGLASGSLTAAGGNYKFSGSNQNPENANWVDVPFNKVKALAIFKWIAASAVIGWPFVAFILRGTMYANENYDPSTGSYFYRFIGWLTNALVLVVMTVLALISMRRPELWPQGPAVELQHVFPLVIALAALTALSLLGTLVAWAKGYWRIPGRLHFTLTILSALGFLIYLNQTGVVRHLIDTNVG